MKYYTLVGSRETPEDICKILTQVARKLCQKGWVVRSGGADGADTCAEVGCNLGVLENCNIYLPWEGFNGRSGNDRGYIVAPKLKNYPQAETIASQVHPAWDKCSRGVKGLHTRNVYQVLGNDLQTPSKFLICWAKPVGDKGNVKGGTNTAVELAIGNGVEVINLYYEHNIERVLKFIGELNE